MNRILGIGERRRSMGAAWGWAIDMNNVSDMVDLMRKLMEKANEAMIETKDGSVEGELATIWEELNTTHGKLIKLRSKLETA